MSFVVLLWSLCCHRLAWFLVLRRRKFVSTAASFRAHSCMSWDRLFVACTYFLGLPLNRMGNSTIPKLCHVNLHRISSAVCAVNTDTLVVWDINSFIFHRLGLGFSDPCSPLSRPAAPSRTRSTRV